MTKNKINDHKNCFIMVFIFVNDNNMTINMNISFDDKYLSSVALCSEVRAKT